MKGLLSLHGEYLFETWVPKLQLRNTLLLPINHISCAQDHMLFHHQQGILHVLV